MPVLMAAPGMPKNSALPSFCAMTTPLADLTCGRAAEPSLPVPVSARTLVPAGETRANAHDANSLSLGTHLPARVLALSEAMVLVEEPDELLGVAEVGRASAARGLRSAAP